jgi:hypothetical protein
MLLAHIFAIISAANGQPIPDDVAALVIAHETSREPKNMVFCAEVAGSDPSAAVLTLLGKSKLAFVPGSACQQGDVRHGTYLKASGQRALIVNAEWFHVTSNSEAEAHVTTYFDGLWSSAVTLVLRQVNGRWAIIGSKDSFVS